MFAESDGRPIDPRRDYREWRELLKAADVRAARRHDARHTAATMLLVLKVPVRAVMDVMGWSEASMASRYMQVPDELKQEIAGQVARRADQVDGRPAGRDPVDRDRVARYWQRRITELIDGMVASPGRVDHGLTETRRDQGVSGIRKRPGQVRAA